eukprot:TRINITY_DN2226_c0_g1_i2.p1 TRINITY_DN2226_c0_g1~~TRINITY_DN2226_c0_g1_i2.p1  ORF type:complete len:124 (-),score=11.25 TRINITY_DN2226_c0_g1_i2:133-504(-)
MTEFTVRNIRYQRGLLLHLMFLISMPNHETHLTHQIEILLICHHKICYKLVIRRITTIQVESIIRQTIDSISYKCQLGPQQLKNITFLNDSSDCLELEEVDRESRGVEILIACREEPMFFFAC